MEKSFKLWRERKKWRAGKRERERVNRSEVRKTKTLQICLVIIKSG